MWQTKSDPGENMNAFVERAVEQLKRDFANIPSEEIAARTPDGLVLSLMPVDVFERARQAQNALVLPGAPGAGAAVPPPPNPNRQKKTINLRRPLLVQLAGRQVPLKQGFNEVDADDNELLESAIVKAHTIPDRPLTGTLQPAPGQPAPFGAEPMPRSEQHSQSGVPTPPSMLGSSDQGAVGPGSVASNAPLPGTGMAGAPNAMDPRVTTQTPGQRAGMVAEQQRQQETARMTTEQQRFADQERQRQDQGEAGRLQEEGTNPHADEVQDTADEARTDPNQQPRSPGAPPAAPPNAPNPPGQPSARNETQAERQAREARERDKARSANQQPPGSSKR